MISKIHSIVPYGFGGRLVEVEGDMNRGLPAFNIVGMANKTVNEAKERVRSALVNSDFVFPDKKVTINLAPAELQKDGTYLDLPIALSVLLLSEAIDMLRMTASVWLPCVPSAPFWRCCFWVFSLPQICNIRCLIIP